MKQTTSFQNRLDESNESIKVTHNNAMQSASQTTESPETAKKRLGLLTVLAVGVDAAASFLKSKMEKAAAVASQVGAAILKSKKAAASAAASVFVGIRPKPPKKARLVVSAPILALLAGIFAVQPTAMATGPYIYWTPSYDETVSRVSNPTLRTPIGGVPIRTPFRYKKSYSFESEITPPSWSVAGWVGKTFYYPSGRIKTSHQTTYYSLGRVASYYLWRNDASDKLRFKFISSHLDLVHHKKVGEQTTYSVDGVFKTRTVETWKNGLYSSDTTGQSDGTVSSYFRTVFSASDSSRAHDDPAGYGMCESTRIAFTSPQVEIPICLPSNMSRPSNGYIEYEFWYYYESSSSNEDDE